jgi:hypothetical protein
MLTQYKGYRIEAFEIEPGRWRVRIERTDGHKIKVSGGDDLIEMVGRDAYSAENATRLARETIDSGRLSRGSKLKTGRPQLLN